MLLHKWFYYHHHNHHHPWADQGIPNRGLGGGPKFLYKLGDSVWVPACTVRLPVSAKIKGRAPVSAKTRAGIHKGCPHLMPPSKSTSVIVVIIIFQICCLLSCFWTYGICLLSFVDLSSSSMRWNKEKISPLWLIFRHPKDVSKETLLMLSYCSDEGLCVWKNL